MALGVGFRITPEVRLRPLRRGRRLSIGPRLGFVRADSGDASPHGYDPADLRLWHGLADGGRVEATDDQPEATDTQVAFGQREHLDRILCLHQVPVARAVRPVLPDPDPIARHEVRRELVARSVEDLAVWRVADRVRARRAARELVDDEVERRQKLLDAHHVTRQETADTWWRQLCEADPEVVIDRLVAAFDEHGLPAAPVSVANRVAYVVLAVDTAEMMIGQREPTLTGAGTISLAIMSESRRNKLYVQAVCAAIVAVAADVFAVVPGAEKVGMAVVCLLAPGGPAVLSLAELGRDAVLPDGADAPVIDDLIASAQQGAVRLVLERSGLDDGPQRLDPQIPVVNDVLEALDLR